MTCWPSQLKNLRYDNYLCNMLTLYLQAPFSMQRTVSTASDFHIQGGTRTLNSIIPWKKKWIPSLKRCRALFLDQFVTQGEFLLEYYDLSLKANTPNRGAILGWFLAL